MDLENFENDIFLANFQHKPWQNNIKKIFLKKVQEYSPKSNHLMGISGSY
jgi:hypothetical protein